MKLMLWSLLALFCAAPFVEAAELERRRVRVVVRPRPVTTVIVR